jgi:chromate transporter
MTLLDFAGVFLRVGTFGFGGLGAALAMIEHELVRERRVVSPQQLADALTYTKLLPGSTVVQIVAYLGYALRGWGGAAVATTAFVLPSALMMCAFAAGTIWLTDVLPSGAASRGLMAAVVGVLAATTLRLARSNVRGATTAVLAVGVCALGIAELVPAAVLVIGAGLVGVARFGFRRG